MAINYKAELNPEQYQAVSTINGPLLILAGAGSGKTRVITFRMAYMLDQGIPQSNILALTFTNKAAREMEERVKSLTGRKLTNLTVSTFHSFGVQVLRHAITSLGWRNNFSIYDATDQNALIREVARELKLSPEQLDTRRVLQVFSAVKSGMRPGFEGEPSHYPLMFDEYQSHLKAYNAVDFDDLIALPLRLFREHPEILEEYRSRFRYLMVDEYQDSSTNQYDFMKLIAEGSRNVCVVGDDDQSIYSWRGANYENIINFERDFPERLEIKLEQNYRSSATILEAANGVIANNTNRKSKVLWTGTGAGNQVQICYPEDESAEAEFIASSISAMALKERLKYHDFGILIRTNSLSRSIEEALLSNNVPYRISGGESFFQRQEIKDVICYLRVIANPEDDMSLLRIINTPRRGIGRKTVEHLGEYASRRGVSLYTAVSAQLHAVDSPLAERIRDDLAGFMGVIEEYRSRLLGRKNLAEGVRELVAALEYWPYLVQEYQKNDKIARWKYANIELFCDLIERWEKDPDNHNPTLYAYLNRISLINRDEADDDQEGKGKVNLMTIHAAKGLEFRIVFLAGVEDGIIPHARAIEENEANVEEERRLFYVAITRAREKLFMSCCQNRKVMRETTSCSPSPFLNEIPVHLMSTIEPEPQLTAEDAEKALSDFKARMAARKG